MSPKWFRRVKNCFIAVSWAPVSGARLVNPDPERQGFIDLFQSFITGPAERSTAGRKRPRVAMR